MASVFYWGTRIILTFILILGFTLFVNAQKLSIEKVKIKDKYSIRLKYESGDTLFTASTAGINMRSFARLPDSLRIEIIRQLLAFEKDTSTCFFEMENFLPVYYKGSIPKNSRYDLRTQALHMINFICFSDYAYFFSPFPCLENSNTGKELAPSSTEIDIVFANYKSWFENCVKNGFKSFYFPLNKTPYYWFGGKQRDIHFNRLQLWEENAAGDMGQ